MSKNTKPLLLLLIVMLLAGCDAVVEIPQNEPLSKTGQFTKFGMEYLLFEGATLDTASLTCYMSEDMGSWKPAECDIIEDKQGLHVGVSDIPLGWYYRIDLSYYE